ASRGIDVKALSCVINYDLPEQPDSYTHRIGRTGRAGATGVAISFCASDERLLLRDIQKITRKIIPVVANPASLPAIPAAPAGSEMRNEGHARRHPQRNHSRSNDRRPMR